MTVSRTAVRAESADVFLNELRTEMDIELHERNVADACEAVDLACLDDENVSGARLEFLAVDDIPTAAFADELDLVVRMTVGPWTAAGSAVEQKDGDAHIAVVGANEVVRAATMREILLSNSVHVFSCTQPPEISASLAGRKNLLL